MKQMCNRHMRDLPALEDGPAERPNGICRSDSSRSSASSPGPMSGDKSSRTEDSRAERPSGVDVDVGGGASRGTAKENVRPESVTQMLEERARSRADGDAGKSEGAVGPKTALAPSKAMKALGRAVKASKGVAKAAAAKKPASSDKILLT